MTGKRKTILLSILRSTQAESPRLKSWEQSLYEETFDAKKQMFDISFELPTGVVSDMIEPWE